MNETRDETSRPEPRPAPLQNFLDELEKTLSSPPPAVEPKSLPMDETDHLGRPQARCFRCGRTPEEIGYPEAEEQGISPTDYVWDEENTLNGLNGHFACDACYIAIGMPTAPGLRGWFAP